MNPSNSATYRTKVKNLVELIKGLHPLLVRIPAPLPRPGSEAFRTNHAKLDAQRKEAYGLAEPKRLDKTAAPFWLSQLSFEDSRRSRG